MDNDSLLPFELPGVARKKVTVAFDGGRQSSDGGVLLLREVERQLGVAERLAGCVTDRRDRARIDHEVVEMLRLRMFAIATGYEDATMSRLENAPSKTELSRMMAAMVDLFCASFAARVVEKAWRIRISLPSACPENAIFARFAVSLRAQPP